MEIVVFDVGTICCGLDILQVQEITRIPSYTPVHGAPPYVTGLMNMRGQIITLIDVRERLGLPRRAEGMAMWSIIVPLRGELVGLLVDTVGDVIRADPECIRPPPPNLHGTEGYFFPAVVETPEGLVALVEKDRIAGRHADASGQGAPGVEAP